MCGAVEASREQERHDDPQVLDCRRSGRQSEPAAGVHHRRTGSRDDVEEDLRREEEHEEKPDAPLRRGRSGVVHAEGEEPEDQRRGRDERHRRSSPDRERRAEKSTDERIDPGGVPRR